MKEAQTAAFRQFCWQNGDFPPVHAKLSFPKALLFYIAT
jgi:hypothetical protein